jgi:hypothetical protein
MAGTRRLSGAALGVALGLAAGVLAVLPAAAAPTWVLPATTISDSAAASTSGHIALDPAGNATAAWEHSVGGFNVVQVVYRPVGGAWGAPVTLSEGGQHALLSDLAVDANDGAVAVWIRSDGTHQRVQAATRSPGGTWSGPTDLSAAGGDTFNAAVAVDPVGNATATWSRLSGPNTIVQTSVRPAGGTWSSPEDRSELGQSATRPSVAAGPDGTVALAWERFNGIHYVVQATVRTAGVWSTPADDVSDVSLNAHDPDVGVDPAGRVTAVWTGFALGHQVIKSATRSPAGDWSAAANVSETDQESRSPAVGVDSAGNATAMWIRTSPGDRVQAASSSAGGAWGPVATLSDPALNPSLPRLGVGAGGTAAVVWTQQDSGGGFRARGASKPGGGTWSSAVPLGGQPSGDAQVAVDPAGNAVAVFGLLSGPVPVLQATALDATAPLVTGLSVPTTGQTGESLSYAATASDSWSAVTGYSWSFGDGGTATGATVGHTYTTAGTYTVTMTATDAVGYAATQSATTSITAPPPLAAPAITTFKLTEKKIQALTRTLSRAVAKKTKLKVGLNTAATLKIIFKSKHKHLVKHKMRYLRVVLKMDLPAGLSKIKIRAKVKGIKLKPDTYKLIGTAKNSAGKSPKKQVKLVVVRP